MIEKGLWQVTLQPKLPFSYNEYKVMYRIGFKFKNMQFLGEYLLDSRNKSLIWFIKPYEKDFDDKLIIFSDEINPSNMWQRNIYDSSIKNEKLKRVFSTFKEDRIFYSSDLCGTDFKQVIDFQIRR